MRRHNWIWQKESNFFSAASVRQVKRQVKLLDEKPLVPIGPPPDLKILRLLGDGT